MEGYRLPFLSVPQLSSEPIPMLLYSPQSIKGKALEEVDPFSCREGHGGARSSFSGLLQPVIRGVEDLRVLAAGDQSFAVELISQQDSIQDGNSCFRSPVGSPRRLGGLSRPQGGLLAGSHPSGQPQVSEVCDLRQGVPVSCTLLRPLDRTTGVHQGYGSCLLDSPQSRYSPSLISGRLAHPGFVSGGLPPLAGDCPLPLSRVGHSRQPGEIQLCSSSTSPVSGHYAGLCIFQGFFPAESREAALNQRRIPVLQATACFYLAGTSRSSLLPLSSRSGRSPPHAVAPADFPSLLGQSGRFCSDSSG